MRVCAALNGQPTLLLCRSGGDMQGTVEVREGRPQPLKKALQKDPEFNSFVQKIAQTSF